MPGPFFRWLDAVWGGKAIRTPDGYPVDFTLGWLGLGYEHKRETGGTDVVARTPDAALIFAGRAVVLDHTAGNVWLVAKNLAVKTTTSILSTWVLFRPMGVSK